MKDECVQRTHAVGNWLGALPLQHAQVPQSPSQQSAVAMPGRPRCKVREAGRGPKSRLQRRLQPMPQRRQQRWQLTWMPRAEGRGAAPQVNRAPSTATFTLRSTTSLQQGGEQRG